MRRDPGSSDEPDERSRAEVGDWIDEPFAAEDRTDQRNPDHENRTDQPPPDAAAPPEAPHHPYARIGSAGGGPYPVRERPSDAEDPKRKPGPEEQPEG